MFFLSWAIVSIIFFAIIFLWVKKQRTQESKRIKESKAVSNNKDEAPFLPTFGEEYSQELTPSVIVSEHVNPSLELPPSYGIDRLVLLVRDPYWLYAYWEITATKHAEFSSAHGSSAWESSWPVLRVYDVTGVAFNGENANKYVDIGIHDPADNWHINAGEPDRSFCVDLGRRFPDGRFITLLRSNIVTTPRVSLSEREDEEWMWIEGIYRTYRYHFGLSSPMITEEIAQRAGALPLGVSSPGQWQKP